MTPTWHAVLICLVIGGAGLYAHWDSTLTSIHLRCQLAIATAGLDEAERRWRESEELRLRVYDMVGQIADPDGWQIDQNRLEQIARKDGKETTVGEGGRMAMELLWRRYRDKERADG